MAFLSPETQYSIKETIRRVGVGAIIKLLLIISLFLYWIWPETPPQQSANQAKSQTIKPDPAPPPSTASMEDIRQLMTASQSSFYWQSFIWMMEHGKELTQRSFANNSLFTSYIKDKPFKAENGFNCLAYSEMIIMSEKSNTHKGIACQISQGSWCKQREGEKAECRHTTREGGIATLDAGRNIELHNLKLNWNNKLSDFGF